MVLLCTVLVALAATAFAGPLPISETECAISCATTTKYPGLTPGNTYTYDFESELDTTILGATDKKTSLYFSSRAELEVHSSCEMLLKIKDSKLEEIEPITGERTPSVSDFQLKRSLTAHPMRFGLSDGSVSGVCANSEDTPEAINIKKAILSSLQNSMQSLEQPLKHRETDISGNCIVDYTVESSNRIRKEKMLDSCVGRQHFDSIVQAVPYELAMEKGPQTLPLLKGSQVCHQTINSDGIPSEMTCLEKQTLRPFSNGDNGATTTIKTSLKYVSKAAGTPSTLSMVTERSCLKFKPVADNKATSRNLRAAKAALTELCEAVGEATVDDTSADFFGKVVKELRRLEPQTFKSLYNEAPAICTKAPKFFLQAQKFVNTEASVKLIAELISKDEVSEDAAAEWMVGLGMTKYPTEEMLVAALPLVSFETLSKPAALGISTLVHTFCSNKENCGSIGAVVNVLGQLENKLRGSCAESNAYEHSQILTALKAIGNAGNAQITVVTTLASCFNNPEAKPEIRVAAINAFRRMATTANLDELKNLFKNNLEDSEFRINAYLMLMQNPTEELIDEIPTVLEYEKINQVGSFVWTHLTNLMEASSPFKLNIARILENEELKKEFDLDKRKFSRNIELSTYLPVFNMGSEIESNLIWSSNSFIPRSASLNLTIDMFGESVNLFEMGGRMEGFENLIEQWMKDKKTATSFTTETGIVSALDQKYKPNHSKPEVSFFMRMFGNEFLFGDMHNFDSVTGDQMEELTEFLMRLVHYQEYEMTKSGVFMETSLKVPTLAGFPITVSLDGTAVVNFKVGAQLDKRGDIIVKGDFNPSASVKLISGMGVDAYVTQMGIKMETTVHASTEAGISIEYKDNKANFDIKLPKEQINVFTVKNNFYTLQREQKQVLPMLSASKTEQDLCYGGLLKSLLNLEVCGDLSYPAVEGSDGPSFPLTGPSSISLSLNRRDIYDTIHFGLLFPDTSADKMTARVEFNTPGSNVNRDVSVVLDVNKGEQAILSFNTPWKTLQFKGTQQNTDTYKSLRGEFINDYLTQPSMYALQAEATITKGTEEKLDTKLTIESPTSSKKYIIINLLKGPTQYSLDAKAENFYNKPQILMVSANLEEGVDSRKFSAESTIDLSSFGGNINGFIQFDTSKPLAYTSGFNSKFAVNYQIPLIIDVEHDLAFTDGELKTSGKYMISLLSEYDGDFDIVSTWNPNGHSFTIDAGSSLDSQKRLIFTQFLEHAFVGYEHDITFKRTAQIKAIEYDMEVVFTSSLKNNVLSSSLLCTESNQETLKAILNGELMGDAVDGKFSLSVDSFNIDAETSTIWKPTGGFVTKNIIDMDSYGKIELSGSLDLDDTKEFSAELKTPWTSELSTEVKYDSGKLTVDGDYGAENWNIDVYIDSSPRHVKVASAAKTPASSCTFNLDASFDSLYNLVVESTLTSSAIDDINLKYAHKLTNGEFEGSTAFRWSPSAEIKFNTLVKQTTNELAALTVLETPFFLKNVGHKFDLSMLDAEKLTHFQELRINDQVYSVLLDITKENTWKQFNFETITKHNNAVLLDLTAGYLINFDDGLVGKIDVNLPSLTPESNTFELQLKNSPTDIFAKIKFIIASKENSITISAKNIDLGSAAKAELRLLLEIDPTLILNNVYKVEHDTIYNKVDYLNDHKTMTKFIYGNNELVYEHNRLAIFGDSFRHEFEAKFRTPFDAIKNIDLESNVEIINNVFATVNNLIWGDDNKKLTLTGNVELGDKTFATEIDFKVLDISILGKLGYTGDWYKFDTYSSLEYQTNTLFEHTINFEFTDNSLYVDGQIKTMYEFLKTSQITINQQMAEDEMTIQANVMHNGKVVSITSGMKWASNGLNGDIAVATPIPNYETIKFAFSHETGPTDMESTNSISFELPTKIFKSDLEFKFADNNKHILWIFKTPISGYEDISISLDHAGGWTSFTSSAKLTFNSVEYPANAKFNVNGNIIDLDLDATLNGNTHTLSFERKGPWINRQFKLEVDAIGQQFDGTVTMKKSGPTITITGAATSNIKNFENVNIELGSKFTKKKTHYDAKIDFGQMQFNFVQDIFVGSMKGSLNLNTPLEALNNIKIAYSVEGPFPNIKISSDFKFNDYEMSYVGDVTYEGIEEMGMKMVLKTPATYIVEMAHKGSLEEFSNSLKLAYNNQVYSTALNFKVVEEDVLTKLEINTPFAELNRASFQLSHTGFSLENFDSKVEMSLNDNEFVLAADNKWPRTFSFKIDSPTLTVSLKNNFDGSILKHEDELAFNGQSYAMQLEVNTANYGGNLKVNFPENIKYAFNLATTLTQSTKMLEMTLLRGSIKSTLNFVLKGTPTNFEFDIVFQHPGKNGQISLSYIKQSQSMKTSLDISTPFEDFSKFKTSINFDGHFAKHSVKIEGNANENNYNFIETTDFTDNKADVTLEFDSSKTGKFEVSLNVDKTDKTKVEFGLNTPYLNFKDISIDFQILQNDLDSVTTLNVDTRAYKINGKMSQTGIANIFNGKVKNEIEGNWNDATFKMDNTFEMGPNMFLIESSIDSKLWKPHTINFNMGYNGQFNNFTTFSKFEFDDYFYREQATYVNNDNGLSMNLTVQTSDERFDKLIIALDKNRRSNGNNLAALQFVTPINMYGESQFTFQSSRNEFSANGNVNLPFIHSEPIEITTNYYSRPAGFNADGQVKINGEYAKTQLTYRKKEGLIMFNGNVDSTNEYYNNMKITFKLNRNSNSFLVTGKIITPLASIQSIDYSINGKKTQTELAFGASFNMPTHMETPATISLKIIKGMNGFESTFSTEYNGNKYAVNGNIDFSSDMKLFITVETPIQDFEKNELTLTSQFSATNVKVNVKFNVGPSNFEILSDIGKANDQCFATIKIDSTWSGPLNFEFKFGGSFPVITGKIDMDNGEQRYLATVTLNKVVSTYDLEIDAKYPYMHSNSQFNVKASFAKSETEMKLNLLIEGSQFQLDTKASVATTENELNSDLSIESSYITYPIKFSFALEGLISDNKKIKIEESFMNSINKFELAYEKVTKRGTEVHNTKLTIDLKVWTTESTSSFQMTNAGFVGTISNMENGVNIFECEFQYLKSPFKFSLTRSFPNPYKVEISANGNGPSKTGSIIFTNMESNINEYEMSLIYQQISQFESTLNLKTTYDIHGNGLEITTRQMYESFNKFSFQLTEKNNKRNWINSLKVERDNGEYYIESMMDNNLHLSFYLKIVNSGRHITAKLTITEKVYEGEFELTSDSLMLVYKEDNEIQVKLDTKIIVQSTNLDVTITLNVPFSNEIYETKITATDESLKFSYSYGYEVKVELDVMAVVTGTHFETHLILKALSHTFKFVTKKEDNQFSLEFHNPSSNLDSDLKLYKDFSNGETYGIDMVYTSAIDGSQKTIKFLVGLTPENKATVALSTPWTSVELSGSIPVWTEAEIKTELGAKVDGMQYTTNIIYNKEPATFELIAQSPTGKSWHLKGTLVPATRGAIEMYRMNYGSRTDDFVFAVRRNSTDRVHTRIHVRPNLSRDIKNTFETNYDSIMNVMPEIHRGLVEEFVARGEKMQPLIQSLRTVGDIFNRHYQANNYYIGDIYESANNFKGTLHGYIQHTSNCISHCLSKLLDQTISLEEIYNTVITMEQAFKDYVIADWEQTVNAIAYLERINYADFEQMVLDYIYSLEIPEPIKDAFSSPNSESVQQYKKAISDAVWDILAMERMRPLRILIQSTMETFNNLYETLQIESRATGVFETLKEWSKLFIEQSVQSVLRGVLQLDDTKFLSYSQESGELQLDVFIPRPALNLPKFPLEKLISTYKTIKSNLPGPDYVIWDTFYTYFPMNTIDQWLPPFKATATIAEGKYFYTFDKRFYSFAGECSYLLAKDFVNHKFAIYVNYESKNGESVKKSITTVVGDKTIDISGNIAMVNNAETALPYVTDEVAVRRFTDEIRIDADGVTVKCNLQYDRCTVNLTGWMYGKTAGLFGTYDNERLNDFYIASKTQATSAEQLANEWTVGDKCAVRNHAITQTTANPEVEDKCKSFFEDNNSHMRPCFKQVDPAPALQMCLMDGNAQNAASFYVAECQRIGVYIELPAELAKCETPNGRFFHPGQSVSLTQGELSQTADVVFVVSRGKCSENSVNNLDTFIAELDQQLKRKGMRGNKYGLVGYGGVGYMAEPSSYAVDGQLYDTKMDIVNALKHFEHQESTNEDALAAMKYAASYIFRQSAEKMIIVVPCAACEEQTVSYDEIISFGLPRDIKYHVLSPQSIKMAGTSSKASPVLGIDDMAVYTHRHQTEEVTQVDRDARQFVLFPSDMCSAAAHATGGTIFDRSQLFRSTSQRRSVNVAAQVIASKHEPSDCYTCSCSIGSLGTPSSVCNKCH